MVSVPDVITEDALRERVETEFLTALDCLQLSPADAANWPTRSQLEEICRRLELLASQAHHRGDSCRSTRSLLIALLRSRCAIIDGQLANRLLSLSEIRDSVEGLRGLTVREIIQAVPLVLSRDLMLGRGMISTVRGSTWLPQRLHVADANDPRRHAILQYIDTAQIPLSEAPLERELVRRGRAAIVTSARDDKRTFKEIIEVSGSRGYVAAPVTAHGRVVGLLHADRPATDLNVTDEHREQVEAFGECVSVVLESAALEEKLRRQAEEVRDFCRTLDAERDAHDPALGPELTPIEMARRCFGGAALGRSPRLSVLTPRECEVLEQAATGATNAQIARKLVISEATVKSHFKAIARKLDTSSRAAAVAIYSGVAKRDRWDAL
jgi:DNA-binding CsgD family transcriptional regulator